MANVRKPMRKLLKIADSLNAFYKEDPSRVDTDITDLLGQPTDIKRWLAGSLAKTIQLQFAPSKANLDCWMQLK